MNTLKTRMVCIGIFFMLIFIPMAQATVVYGPVDGCVGFPDWWTSPESAIDMIYFVQGLLIQAGYSDEMILNIAAGLWYYSPLP